MSFALSIFLQIGTKLRSLDKNNISASLRFLFDKLTTFLLTKLSLILPSISSPSLLLQSKPLVSLLGSEMLFSVN